MSERLALYLLGPPKVELDRAAVSIDRRKVLALLAYLAVNRWQHHRDHISALFWPEYAQPKAFSNLRHILWEVQQIIGEGWIIASRDTVGLIAEGAGQPNRQVIWLDVSRFESLITESRLQKNASLRAQLLADSVKLYRDHFLTGFSLKNSLHFNEWAFAQSDNLRYQLAGALTMLSDDLCSLGRAEAAIPHAQRLIALDPLNEASHRQLMQIYVQAGQHNAALKQYQTCEKLLRRELGVDPQPETHTLYRQIRKGVVIPIQPVKPKESGTPEHNLPFQISRFIGRENEQDEVAVMIARHRLVSLVGPGGIGKTRLSLRVGENVLKDYANGVWFVELASLKDSVLVPQTVAKLFHLLEQAEESLTEKLIRVLRSKNILLILDNCEHLLDACAQLADELLRNCPNLKILTTSREPLGITGEAQYHVPPLGLPDVQPLLEGLLGHESIQLFEERARLVQEHFALTMDNASSVAHICHRLDGIPLAIELAAARVDEFSTQQIAERLDESFNLLTGGSRTALPRQHTLHASIDWSWNLLSQPEQILLRRLSIFAGGWTLSAAVSICAGIGNESFQTHELITQLAAKSLVVVSEEDGCEQRYHLLEMIREFGSKKLSQAGEEDAIQAQHLKYYLNLSEELEYGLMGPQQVELMTRTIEERDNLRAALEHAARTDVEAGLLLSARLRNFWENFDMREGGRWNAEFLGRDESHAYPAARARALFAHGWTLLWFHRLEEARAMAEECLALYRAAGDRPGEVDGLNLMGAVTSDAGKRAEYCQRALALARSLGDLMRQTTALNQLGWDHRDYKRAFAAWEEAINLYRQMGSWRYLASVLSMLGLFMVMEGEVEPALKFLEESERVYQKLSTKTGKGHLLIAYGQIALLRGDYEQARAYLLENARIGEESGSRIEYLWSRVRLGHIELRAGNITAARTILDETARSFQRDGSKIGVVFALEGMAGLHVLAGKPESAARLIGWADATRAMIGTSRPFLETATIERDTAAIVSRIGTDSFEDACKMGRLMMLEEAVDLALEEMSP
jgi:predicted ATPase/DNA-binding SARP family transcriptional activator